MRRYAMMAGALLLVAEPSAGRAQQPRLATVGVVRDSRTGEGVGGASVEVVGRQQQITTAADGTFTVVPEAGPFRFRVLRLGYAMLDTTVAAGGSVVLRVREEPIELSPLTVRSARLQQEGPERERELFRQEAVPGVIGIGRRELRAVPAMVEPDVLRSLQALPGVMPTNDLSAELHVRGGSGDQNLVLLDGAPILAPFHLFGMFGAFNPDAVGRVNFFRGGLPARYGGALSSVVDVRQWHPPTDTLVVEGGVSLLAARLTGKGTLPLAAWRVAPGGPAVAEPLRDSVAAWR